MTPDELALLAAVRAAPADDTPRLVYADWLDEHGRGERAELIRVQVELPKLKHRHHHGAPPCRACKLARRAQRLLGWCADELRPAGAHGWVVRSQFTPARRYSESQVRRGFVEVVRCRAADWLTSGDELTCFHPVGEVRLLTPPGDDWPGLLFDAAQADVLFCDRWPGVRFRLPPSEAAG